jgi:hypothetical protein
VGLDYNSGVVWDRFLRFEENEANLANQNTLYWRLVSIAQKGITGLPLR